MSKVFVFIESRFDSVEEMILSIGSSLFFSINRIEECWWGCLSFPLEIDSEWDWDWDWELEFLPPLPLDVVVDEPLALPPLAPLLKWESLLNSNLSTSDSNFSTLSFRKRAAIAFEVDNLWSSWCLVELKEYRTKRDYELEWEKRKQIKESGCKRREKEVER